MARAADYVVKTVATRSIKHAFTTTVHFTALLSDHPSLAERIQCE